MRAAVREPSGKESPESRVPSVNRALDLLEVLSQSTRGLSLSEISRELGIPKSTTHNLISTLDARGYLQRIPWTRLYSVGLRAGNLASRGRADLQLRRFYITQVRALAEKVGTGVQVSVLRGCEGMVIDRVDPRPLRPGGTKPGRHFHLHCTAAGKVLIAWQTDDELQRYFPGRHLFKFTANTIRDFEKLKLHLGDVRREGYAVSDEEYMLARRALAAPIFNDAGCVMAALSLDGSTTEIPIERIAVLADHLRESAQDISRLIVAR